jgi:indolepyruvate ferredoxin oxidoreductase alpha subunit
MEVGVTPVHGGLVVLLGDDPGAYGSQNDQDSRPLATLAETPMLEPSGPTEGLAMMREAFELSERFGTGVIIRETRAFSQLAEPVMLGDEDPNVADLGLPREPWRFIAVPLNAVEKHRELHRRIEAVGAAPAAAMTRSSTGGRRRPKA